MRKFYVYWFNLESNFAPGNDGGTSAGKRSNVTIALIVLHAKKEKEIYPAYISKNNSNIWKQVILSIILNGEKQWHYLAVKPLSALLRVITSKNNGGVYCLNCLHSFRTKKTRIT